MLEPKESPEEHPIHLIIQLNRGIKIIDSFTNSLSSRKTDTQIKSERKLKPQRRKLENLSDGVFSQGQVRASSLSLVHFIFQDKCETRKRFVKLCV